MSPSAKPTHRPRLWKALLSLLACALVVLSVACGSDRPPALEDGPASSMFSPGTSCRNEGQVVDCHAVVARHEGYVDCFNGKQICTNGVWGPCQGDPNGTPGTVTTKAWNGGGLKPAALSTPGYAGAPCSSDPCNPNCQGYDEQPPTPVQPTCASAGASIVAASQCQVSSQWWSDNQIGCSAANQDDCFFGDTCCTAQTATKYAGTAACGYNSTGTKYCIARSVAGSACPAACAQADYTAAPACETADGHAHVTICNRGAAASPSSGNLVFAMFAAGDSRKECGSCGGYGSALDHFSGSKASCAIDLSVLPFAANGCRDIDLTSSFAGSVAGIQCSPSNYNLSGAFGIYVNMYSSASTQSGADTARLPTAAVGNVWTAPNDALTSDGLSATATISSVALNATAAADTGTASDTAWTAGVNAASLLIDSGAAGAATTTPAKNKQSVMALTYGATIPAGATVAGVQVNVNAKIASAGAAYVYNVDLLTSGGAVAANVATNQALSTAYPASPAQFTVASSAWGANTPNWAGQLVRITVKRGNDNTARVVTLDGVSVKLLYAYTQEWGTFNINVPSNATITQIDWTAAFANANRDTDSTVTIGAFASGTQLTGATQTLTSATTPALPAGTSTVTWSDTGLSLAASNFANGTFTVRATASGGGTFVAGLDYVRVLVHYTTPVTVAAATCAGTNGLAECNDCNNWSGMDLKNGAHPQCPAVASATAPLSYTNTYTLQCPAGTTGHWGLFAYDANVPTGADIKFAVQVSDSASGPWTPATAGPPAGLQVADAPIDHPASCSMTGPSPCGTGYPASCSCPIDVGTALASASANADQMTNLTLNVLLTPSCAGTPTFNAPPSAFGGSPPGFTAKGVCGAHANGSAISAGCSDLSACSNNPNHYSVWDACQFDYRCDTASNKCVKNQPGDKWPTTVCPVGEGPDLTVGPSCTINGVEGFPVCNRGNDPVASGEVIEIYLSNGNSWDYPTSAGGASQYHTPTCTYTPTSAIAPGDCVWITSANSVDFVTGLAPGCSASGNSLAYVNSRQRIKECGMTGWTANAYLSPLPASRPTGNTPGTSNNDADVKTGNGACQTTSGGTSAVPSLSGWSLTYSCVPSE